MSLNVKAFACALGIIWGGALCLTALVNVAFPSYGLSWLQLAASIYPGYHGPGGPWDVVVLTLYGLVDGAAAGALCAWLYNRLARPKRA